MRTICSYCRKEGEPKPPLDSEDVSFTMCDECFAHYRYQWADAPLDTFLEGFDGPVLVVDANGRVAGINGKAEAVLGKTAREAVGLLGGEVMECAYARLPGGCGQTYHCAYCTIRNTVMQTMETGDPSKQVPAFLNRRGQGLRLRISTERHDHVVIVRIEDVWAVPVEEPESEASKSA